MREVGGSVEVRCLQHMTGSRWLGVSSLGPWPVIERRFFGTAGQRNERKGKERRRRRRLVGIDFGFASAHTVRGGDEGGETVAKRECKPTVDSLTDVGTAALAGTPEGIRWEVMMDR